MGDRLATIDMGQKVGGYCAPFCGGLGLYLTQCGLGWGLPPYQVASWSIQPFGHNTPTSQTDTTDRQTNRTDRQRSDSIGRTVLQTVTQKLDLNQHSSQELLISVCIIVQNCHTTQHRVVLIIFAHPPDNQYCWDDVYWRRGGFYQKSVQN